MSDKRRFEYYDAMKVAVELRAALEPCCHRIEIAGSLRRQKPDVGDIELLMIPKFRTIPVFLFGEQPEINEADSWIEAALSRGILEKRPSKVGVLTWGPKNKLAIHVPSGIPVDFFSTTSDNWWNSLVCRTGGKANNLLITTTAQKKGYRFEAYGSGFLTREGYHKTTSERDVYDFLGLPYLEPKDRP